MANSREISKNKELRDSDLRIDIGAADRDDALRYVRLGDTVTFDTDVRELVNDRVAARALDDRVGAFIVMEAVAEAKKRGTKVACFGVSTAGKGPVICNNPSIHKKLNLMLTDCAGRMGMAIQTEAAGGCTGTDGDTVHRTGVGVPFALVSVPLRYMHNPAEVADMKDVRDCIDLLAEFLSSCPEAPDLKPF